MGEPTNIDRLLGRLESQDLSSMNHEARRWHQERVGNLRIAAGRVALAEVVEPDMIDVWLDTPNDMFGGQRPVDVLRSNPDAVRDLIRRLTSGEPD